MSSAKFTLWGCEKYFNTLNQSVFDNLRVPEGLTKETLTDNILLRGGEFEVQYGNPDFVRLAIGAWSNKWMPTMERWVRALAIEYNPLENYDRMEDWTDNTTRSDAVSSSDTSDRIQGRKEDISHADAEGYTESTTGSGSETRSEAGSESKSDAGSETRHETGNENVTDSGAESNTTESNEMRSDSNNESAQYSQSDAKSISENVEKLTNKDVTQHPLTTTTERSAYDSNSYEPLTKVTEAGQMEETVDTSRSESGATSSDSSSTKSGSSSASISGEGSSSYSKDIDTDKVTDETINRSSAGLSEHASNGSTLSNNSGSLNSSKEGSFAESKDESENENVTSSHDSSSAMNNDFVHSGRIHGNIGVTTSQQMLQSELDLGYWNVYEKITELFLQEFTIPVYV